MSTARPTASADATRRQLDELDALLQRMLALPVAPPDDDPILSEEPPDNSLAVVDPPAPTPPPLTVRVVATPLATVLEPPGTPTTLTLSPTATEVESPELPLPRRRRVWPRPLLWSNRVFDQCTDPLGAAGRWLRGRTGRTVLGVIGLLFLAAAVAIVAMDWAGWIW